MNHAASARVAAVLAAAVLALALAPSGARAGADVRPLRLEVTEWENQAVLLPAHVPVPQTSDGIGPGSRLLTNIQGGLFLCTANFIWNGGGKKYLGSAGHCFLPENATATHGPGADYPAASTTASVCVSACTFGGLTGQIFGGTYVALGPVRYARQKTNGIAVGNDFGIVEIPTSLYSQIRNSLPMWGGPTQAAEAATLGKTLCHYGHGIGTGEAFPIQGRIGVAGGTTVDSWGAFLASNLGDSGSAVEACALEAGLAGFHGRGAVGILTHLGVGTGTTFGTTVAQAVQLAQESGVTLALQTGA